MQTRKGLLRIYHLTDNLSTEILSRIVQYCIELNQDLISGMLILTDPLFLCAATSSIKSLKTNSVSIRAAINRHREAIWQATATF